MESQFVISVIAVAIVANFVTYVHPTPVDGRIIRSILINSTSPTTMRPISDEFLPWPKVAEKLSSSDSHPISDISSNRKTRTEIVRTVYKRFIYLKAPIIGCRKGEQIDGKCKANPIQTTPSNCPDGQVVGPDKNCRLQFRQNEED